MLIESAFSMLPESVAGYGFQKVNREANAVGSFAFSLLNALHAKNILDPIQRIQLEMPYGTQKVPLPAGSDNRHCDVFLDYGGSKLGTANLANYGWRYRNFLEAKFLKSYSRTKSGQDTKSSSNSAEVVADLFRLVALLPEPQAQLNQPSAKTSSARYFLCMADHPPSIFINKYLTDLYAVFDAPKKATSIRLDLTSGKAGGPFSEKVGAGFSRLDLNITHATCFAHYPLDPAAPNSIWMLLVRIDGASIAMTGDHNSAYFSIGLDRSLTQSQPGAYSTIRNFIAANIK